MNEPNATTTATGSDVENILVSVSKHDLNKLEAAYARSLDRIEKLETALWDERLSALDVDDGLVAALARVARLEAALSVYADEANWSQEYEIDGCNSWLCDSNGYTVARAALEAQP